MTTPIHPIPPARAKLDAPSQAMLRSQIDCTFFALPRPRRAQIDDWRRRMRDTTQPALT
ncbi:hypothetical protein [Ralstonia sp. UBA689]|uniref:hypothetical protein n=1 Tax=Ralstonia sp. UBA689 TaxID=1947373 RepID=UPI0025DE1438|nr:hypothetical protein [Ralstonia sp. UBA689]